jgi:hypothetical protein
MLVSNVLDLSLSYLGFLIALVVVFPVLNSRLLDLRQLSSKGSRKCLEPTRTEAEHDAPGARARAERAARWRGDERGRADAAQQHVAQAHGGSLAAGRPEDSAGAELWHKHEQTSDSFQCKHSNPGTLRVLACASPEVTVELARAAMPAEATETNEVPVETS